MKRLKKFFKWLAIIIVLLVATLYITDTDYLLKAVRTIYLTGHTTAYLKDYQKFDNHTVTAAQQPQPWPLHKDYNSISVTEKLAQQNKELGTVAYLIFKNDSIWFEEYYDDISGLKLDASGVTLARAEEMGEVRKHN